ncbi:MAG: DUF3572 domain-containing protein, partial [Hypericibacter sp.]
PTPDPETLALMALAYIAGDSNLLERFLSLSGLDLEGLKARAQYPNLLGAILDFLLAHEPDLMAFATDSQVLPASIAAARRKLPGGAVID